MVNKKSQIKYCVSDAWLLASIEFSSGKRWASIRDIIAAGDYMDHATFLEKQFEEGLYRLSKDRWIRKNGDTFKVSKRFKDHELDYSSGRGGIHLGSCSAWSWICWVCNSVTVKAVPLVSVILGSLQRSS